MWEFLINAILGSLSFDDLRSGRRKRRQGGGSFGPSESRALKMAIAVVRGTVAVLLAVYLLHRFGH
jgi:hypothetical protein